MNVVNSNVFKKGNHTKEQSVLSKGDEFKRRPSTHRSKSRYNYAPKKTDSLDDIKNNLRKIFEYYVSYGERMNLKYMRSNKFLKLMQDVNIP